jgi:hypothetical protein
MHAGLRKEYALFKALLGLCFVLGAVLYGGQAEARVPVKVAMVPIVQEGYMSPGDEARHNLDVLLERSVHVPLNGVLQAVEYVPEETVIREFIALDQAAGGKRHETRKAVVKALAEKTGADVAILPVLTNYEEWVTSSFCFDWGSVLHSYVSWDLFIYDARTGENFCKTTSRYYHDSYSTWGLASQLAKEALDEALQGAKVHDRIWPDLKES